MDKPSKYKFTLRGVDITSFVVRSDTRKTKHPIKITRLLLKISADASVTLDKTIIGKEILIQRGFVSATERYIFRGEVISKQRNGSVYELTCACKMNRANRLETDYVYDEVIDVEAGVGSEIVKSLFGVIGLNYNASSVPTTGSVNTIKTFLAKGATKKSLDNLGSIYGRHYFYRDSDDLAYFIEPTSETTTTELETGIDIVGRIRWNDTGEDLINNLTVIGGKQLDWTEESFTGTFSEVIVTANPVDTDIKVGGTQLQRGVNSSDPKDFYVDTTNKKIIFTVSQTDPVVRYSYSVPIKVNTISSTSISDFYRVDRTIIDTKLLTSDDAELLGQGLLDNNDDALTSAPIRVIGNNDLEVGQEIRVIDDVNNYDVLVDVQGISIFYPYRPDEVSIGMLPKDNIDFDKEITSRLAELERQLSTTSDINVSLVNPVDAVLGLEVYTKVEKATMDADTLYWDSDAQGDWGNDAGTTGFNWGDDTEETYTEVYKEVGYDD